MRERDRERQREIDRVRERERERGDRETENDSETQKGKETGRRNWSTHTVEGRGNKSGNIRPAELSHSLKVSDRR